MKQHQNYIELYNIQKSYNDDVILSIDNYVIPLDGMITIVGFSGNGKTTLLNIIGLLDVPDSIDGAKIIYKINYEKYEITFENKKIKITKDNGLIDTNYFRREYLSFVFQENMLHPSLSPESNVLMPLKASNYDYDSNINDLFTDAGLENGQTKSGGQKQRTAILRAIIKKSKIIFADEPTSSLDLPRATQALNVFKDKNTIWVTHDMLLAKKFSKYIIVVEKGKLCPLLENNENLNILDKLENGCITSNKKKLLKNIEVKNTKVLPLKEKLFFVFEYAKNDLFKPRKDFVILLLITIFTFLSILLMNKISHSLDTIIQNNLNDPRVSYVQIIANSGINKFDEEDMEKLKKSLREHPKLKNKCTIAKLRGYPMVKFKKADGTQTYMSLGTFERDNKLFIKMLKENEFIIKDIDINKTVENPHYLWIKDNLNFVIIGKEAREQHEVVDQYITRLGELDKDISVIYAKDKLPHDHELFIRDEFLSILFHNNPPEDFAIMFYPDDIATSLVLLTWLKDAKINYSIIDKQFFISDETDKFNSLKLITTIENIVSVMMGVVLSIIISLLMIVGYFNISNNIKQKYKELGMMLAFGMPKRYFVAFYITKALLLIIISIVLTIGLFYFIEAGLDIYLRTQLFSNILAIANVASNEITDLSLPLLKQVLIFVTVSVSIVVLFLVALSFIIFKMPSELIKE